MTLLRRLRPEKRSCVGSTARRLVVTNMFSILLLFERCARPSPSGLAGRARCRPRARLGGEDWVILADRPISLSGPSVGLAGGDGRTGGRADRRTGGRAVRRTGRRTGGRADGRSGGMSQRRNDAKTQRRKDARTQGRKDARTQGRRNPSR